MAATGLAYESYHLSVHRIDGNQRFHVALSDSGRVVDVCMSAKRPELAADSENRVAKSAECVPFKCSLEFPDAVSECESCSSFHRNRGVH